MLPDADMEQSENWIEKERFVREALGYLSFDRYEEQKNRIVRGMVEFGDVFIQNLGATLAVADLANSVKIISLWRSKCAEYAMLFQMAEAKKKAGAG